MPLAVIFVALALPRFVCPVTVRKFAERLVADVVASVA